MNLCFDVETNGFLDRPDLEIHCIVARDVDTGKEFICDTSTEKPQGGFKTFCKGILGQATRLIGHNIAQYDLPVLERLLGWAPAPEVELYDTLFASRLIFVSNMYARSVKCRRAAGRSEEARDARLPAKFLHAHSLEAWGYGWGGRRTPTSPSRRTPSRRTRPRCFSTAAGTWS